MSDTRTRNDVVVEMGWGRLVFGQTYVDPHAVATELRDEALGQRDICVYHPDPHVLVSAAPHELFVDPSHTYRFWFVEDLQPWAAPGVRIRPMDADDIDAVNQIYLRSGMVSAPSDVMAANAVSDAFVYLVAEDEGTAEVIGTVTGVDHLRVFDDREEGCSLWCLAVDPQAMRGGVGESLTRSLLAEFSQRGRLYLDLSVMHDNVPALRLYEKLGFVRVPVYAVKRKNPINERFFVAPPSTELEALNPYARIIADEARRRGIIVDVIDAEGGFLRLTQGGRSIVTRESLSEMTSAVAVSWSDDKRVTRRLLAKAGLRIPRGQAAGSPDADEAFLTEVGEVVVKPARGEQGRGITVGVTGADELRAAVARAREHCPDVLLEECCTGEDLRIVVINHEVVAAAIRRPASVVGDGENSVAELIAAQSRRRAAATGGESTIPMDDTTIATVRTAGWELDSVLPPGERLQVRRTANLHTGGTIHDVTDQLHPRLADAAVQASRVLQLPVTGLDLLVPDPGSPDYVIIEANERPGLANHEPQPTAQRFVDLLFPTTTALPRGVDG